MSKSRQRSTQTRMRPGRSARRLDYGQWLQLTTQLSQKQRLPWWQLWGQLQQLIGRLRGHYEPDRLLAEKLLTKLESARLTAEEAYGLTQTASARLNLLQSRLPLMLLNLVGGGLLAAIGFGVLVWIFFGAGAQAALPSYWRLLGAAAGGIGFGMLLIGLRQRREFVTELSANGAIAQSAAALVAAKSPGRGGSLNEARAQLVLIRKQLKRQNALGNLFKRKS